MNRVKVVVDITIPCLLITLIITIQNKFVLEMFIYTYAFMHLKYR